jgi:hypothetical protein
MTISINATKQISQIRVIQSSVSSDKSNDEYFPLHITQNSVSSLWFHKEPYLLVVMEVCSSDMRVYV